MLETDPRSAMIQEDYLTVGCRLPDRTPGQAQDPRSLSIAGLGWVLLSSGYPMKGELAMAAEVAPESISNIKGGLSS